VPRTGSVLTDNVVADIVDVEMTWMDGGLTVNGFDVFGDNCELDDNVDGVDTELLDDDDGLSTVLI
jgi:hypothetical protein